MAEKAFREQMQNKILLADDAEDGAAEKKRRKLDVEVEEESDAGSCSIAPPTPTEPDGSDLLPQIDDEEDDEEDGEFGKLKKEYEHIVVDDEEDFAPVWTGKQVGDKHKKVSKYGDDIDAQL